MSDSKLLKEHKDAVSRISSQVRQFYDAKKHFRVYHGSTSSTRPMNFTRDAIVDVSDMTRMFPVDKASRTVQVEPKVPMDLLVQHTLKAGMVPQVVMELKGITAGGGFSGISGESSSFRYGMFQSTCSEIEIVLGDGSVTTASRDHQSDLLSGAGGSMGTLGIVTLLTVQLIEAKSHVNLELRLFSQPTDIPAAMEEAATKPDVDFIDGIYYEPDVTVLMLGQLTDKPTGPVLKKMQVHWFADEVMGIMKKKTKATTTSISMKLEDYFFRYDHGAFWGGKLAFQHFHVPNNRITRRLADPLLDSRTCYVALHKTGLGNEYLVQDFGIPASTVTEFIKWVTETLPHLQLFMCPGKSLDDFGFTNNVTPQFREKHTDRLFGIGVYGRGPAVPKDFVEMNQQLERKAFELLGTKLLYARVYCTEEEFWATYDREHYDGLRVKYKADRLPTVYDKLAADMSKLPTRRPVRGILETILDKARGKKEYILKK
jgi:delta24-sterol reductase